MGFQNPAVLWGMLALAVPIIVHFFNLQRPKRFLFSNVAFVKEVKKTVVKRVKFKQWLLLLARLLALAALIFAFANPVWISEEQPLRQGNRSVAIVIDNSYSMKSGNENGPYFPQAISLSRQIIKSYTQEDEFLIMGSDELLLNANFSNQSEALEALKGLQIQQQVRSHTELLGFQEQLFARANHNVKELYFLSDFQVSTVMADSGQIDMIDSLLVIKYLPLASRPQKNVYIQDQTIESQVLEEGKPIALSMTLVNDGGSAVNDIGIRVSLENKAVAIDNASLEANRNKEVNTTFTPVESGWLGGYLEVDDNPIDFDNRRYFTLYVPEKEKVLVAEGKRSTSIRILYQNLFTQFDAEFVSARDLSSIELSSYRSLVLVGITELSSGLSDKLQSFLNDGGSILFFPGEDVQLDRLNDFFQKLQVGRLSPAVSVPEGLPASEAELQHPLFETIFSRNQTRREFDAPTVYRYFPIQLQNGLVQNRIISLENQRPILLESIIGKGRLFTFSLFPDDAWTDMHVKTIFTPLMFRLTQLMNQTQLIQSGQELGYFEPKVVRTESTERIDLVDESGTTFTPDRSMRGNSATLMFDQMDLHEGIYQIVQNGKLLEKIAFNISDAESKLAFLDQAALTQQLKNGGYENISILKPESQSIEQQIQVEKEGTPLWKYFVWFALLFFLAEIFILRFRDL